MILVFHRLISDKAKFDQPKIYQGQENVPPLLGGKVCHSTGVTLPSLLTSSSTAPLLRFAQVISSPLDFWRHLKCSVVTQRQRKEETKIWHHQLFGIKKNFAPNIFGTKMLLPPKSFWHQIFLASTIFLSLKLFWHQIFCLHQNVVCTNKCCAPNSAV